VLLSQKRFVEAEPLLRECIAHDRKVENRWGLGYHFQQLIQLVSALGRPREAESAQRGAESVLREDIAIRRKTAASDDRHLSQVLVNLGGVLLQLGSAPEAEPLFQEALKLSGKNFPPTHRFIGLRESELGGCLTALKRFDEAELNLLSAYRIMQANSRTRVELPRAVLDRIITLYESWRKSEQVPAWRPKRMDSEFPVDPFVH
jgi:tetratricopeptide (TPR) repeat protein